MSERKRKQEHVGYHDSVGEEDDVEIDLEEWRSSASTCGYRGVTMRLDGRYEARIKSQHSLNFF